jgi:hypothetical protein
MIIKDQYKNLPCYIIGKGPSILNLNNIHIENKDAPIIALYQATHKVESLNLDNPIYSLQKDGCAHKNGMKAWQFNPPTPAPIGHTCNNTYMFSPKNATVLLHDKESKNCLSGYNKKIIFSLEEIDIPKNRKYYWLSFSLECAVRIAMKWGCVPIKLLCCDSCANGNTECLEFNQNLSYSYRSNQTFNKTNYPKFCIEIYNILKNYPHKWITPQLSC